MKLKKSLVFSTDCANLAGLCSGGNLLAGETAAVVLGAKEQAEALLNCAAKVLWLGEKAADQPAEAYAGALEAAVRAEGAELLLLSCGTRDRCLAAKLAVRLDASVITDVSALTLEDGALTARRNVYGGTAEATVRSVSKVTIVLASPALFEETRPAAPGALEELAAAPDGCGLTLLGTEAKQEESVDITAAKRIVAVGRGVGSEENLALVGGLAAKLGAELGCTRPIAEEAHWMARGRYIGVSGVTVRPELYLALGVSGQIQHMVGASSSKVIVAVNKDGKAPIFSNCDIGLVADLNKVLPALTELF